jgi:hypothetical protein
MIYILPTKRGIGVEFWGTSDDLENFYDVISKFWNDETYIDKKGFENRNVLISGFSYEIRKAFEGSRLKRETSHFSGKEQEYFGCQISWVHFLFSLTAIKVNMQFHETNKFDVAQILLIEFWLEKAMRKFDAATSTNLIGFIEGGLHGANNYIYQYMRSINLDYYLLGGGKQAFKKLPELLRRGIFHTNEYNEYEKYLHEEAKRLSCDIADLELSDDDVDYEKIRW